MSGCLRITFSANSFWIRVFAGAAEVELQYGLQPPSARGARAAFQPVRLLLSLPVCACTFLLEQWLRHRWAPKSRGASDHRSLQDAQGDGEGSVGGRNPAVDRALQEHLLDLFVGEAVAHGSPDVQRQLLELRPRHERGQGDAAASLAVEPGPRSDLAPRVPSYEVLEVGGERRRTLHRGVDVLGAKDLPTHLHASLVDRAVSGHVSSLATACRCSSTVPVIASGLSTLARCAAGERISRRASGTESRIDSDLSGGAAGSSAPAMIRVGARMSPSLSPRSAPAIASQHPA